MIKTEEKAKVVTAVWGAELIAAQAILPRTILKNWLNSSFYFNSSDSSNRPSAKQLARQGIE